MDSVREQAQNSYFGALGQLDPVLQILILVLTGITGLSLGANVWLVRFIFNKLLNLVERNLKVKTALIEEFRRLRSAKSGR